MYVSTALPTSIRSNIARVWARRRLVARPSVPTTNPLARVLPSVGESFGLLLAGVTAFAVAAFKVWTALHP